MLRSDNGGEYTSSDFVDFCKREYIVPYNPKQNGMADRNNDAIVGATRAMIHDQGLSLFLWVEAYNTAIYLENRSPRSLEEYDSKGGFLRG